MVDIIDIGLAVDKANEVLDDLDDVFLGEHTHIIGGGETQLLVDAETSHVAQVITLLAEEQVVDDLASASVIGWLGVAQLSIDVVDGLFLAVASVFVKGVEDNLILSSVDIFFMEEDSLNARVEDFINVVLLDDGVAVYHHVVTLNRNHLTGVLVNEVFVPRLEHAGGKLAAYSLLEVGLVHFNLFGQPKYLDDVVVGLQAYRAQQCCHGQLLLAVDVGIHHIVDIGGKLNPAAAEGDDARRIELCAISMHALPEEHARRAVQLRNDDALGTVDDKSALVGHVRDGSQIHVLDNGSKVLMVGVGAVELELGLEGDAIGQPTVEALLHCVARRIDKIVKEFKDKVVASVRNGEVLAEHFIESLVFSFLCRSI